MEIDGKGPTDRVEHIADKFSLKWHPIHMSPHARLSIMLHCRATFVPFVFQDCLCRINLSMAPSDQIACHMARRGFGFHLLF